MISISVVDPRCLSRIQIFSIPDPNFVHPGSASKNFSIFNPKKLFLSSRKYDPACSSRTRILIFLPNPGPGSRGLKKGTRSRDLQHWFQFSLFLRTVCEKAAYRLLLGRRPPGTSSGRTARHHSGHWPPAGGRLWRRGRLCAAAHAGDRGSV